jgi:hypothetical protein
MGDYLKITGDPADIIGTASLISGAAESLQGSLTGLVAAVEALESPGTIGGDSFATEFLKNYHQSVAVGDGADKFANDATKDSAKSLAEQAIQIGDAASGAMTDYVVTDGLGQTDIASLGT